MLKVPAWEDDKAVQSCTARNIQCNSGIAEYITYHVNQHADQEKQTSVVQ